MKCTAPSIQHGEFSPKRTGPLTGSQGLRQKMNEGQRLRRGLAGAEGLKQRRFTHGPLRELPIGSVCQEQKLQLTGPSERSLSTGA